MTMSITSSPSMTDEERNANDNNKDVERPAGQQQAESNIENENHENNEEGGTSGDNDDNTEREEETKNWKRKRFEQREGETDADHGTWKKINIELDEENNFQELMGGLSKWKKSEREMKEEETAANPEEWGRWRRKKCEEVKEEERHFQRWYSRWKKTKTEEMEGGEWSVDLGKAENQKHNKEKESGGASDNISFSSECDENNWQYASQNDSCSKCRVVCKKGHNYRSKQYRNSWRRRRTEELDAEKNEGDEKVDWRKANIFTEEDNNHDNLEGKTKGWKRTETIINEDLWQPECDGGDFKRHKKYRLESINENESEHFGAWKSWNIKTKFEMQDNSTWKPNTY
ncbi:hypothetical protein C0J52_09648 [Blattella germanica]|nr:hypothetical protein C0J52_09648 [Blattella germanica]